ncbi:MAG: glycosyltransferase family 4 protein [Acidobacteriaceae bacterium]|nr:glycosyltransferase family 4 protein [Acidobacteriaceae bacterium]
MFRLRVLHIDTGTEMRGGQYQVLLLMKALREAGDSQVFLGRPKTELWRQAADAGFAVHRASLANVWRRSKRVDVVHAHDARAHTLAAIASRKPIVVSRRVAFPVGKSVGSRWKYGRATRYIAVSQAVSEQLQAAGVNKDKIDVVYDAVDTAAGEADWSPEHPAVALATDDPQKGRDLVERAARQSGIHVIFSESLIEDLRRASLFVYISRDEGLGSAALIAMSMGVPVIASRIGGLTEAVADGVSGLLVNNDATEIAVAMRKVLGDRKFALRLIEAAKQRVAERFTKDRLVERTVSAYARAIAS